MCGYFFKVISVMCTILSISEFICWFSNFETKLLTCICFAFNFTESLIMCDLQLTIGNRFIGDIDSTLGIIWCEWALKVHSHSQFIWCELLHKPFSPCNRKKKQVCIPVGCVPPACCPYLPACTVQGNVCFPGVSASQGECLLPKGGVCFPRGVSAPRGCVSQHALGQTPPPHPWTEWLTDRCKNITFANFVCGR